MAKILWIGFLFLAFTKGITQETKKSTGDGKIIGKIIDSVTKKPVEYATITLYQQGNKKILTGTVTDSAGRFTLTDINTGTYKMVVEFIGYPPHAITDIIIDKPNLQVDIKDIFLSLKGITLQNVTITTPTRLIENKIDKLVFNAEKDITSQGGVATDILKKIPQVSVDVDGNVELAGSSSIRFLINGKPSAVFGSNIADVLQSIPASQIKSIEVITTPGAKYDAQGLGGIINIILKESKVKGINGNLSLSAGTRNENGSFNLNARKDNFGFNFFISGNARPNVKIPSSFDRLTVDTIADQDITLAQEAGNQFKRHGIETGIGFDWTWKKRNNLNGSVHYGNFGNKGTSLTNKVEIKNAQNGGAIISVDSTINNRDNKSSSDNTDLDLTFKRTFKKEDQELEIALNSSFDNSRGTANNYQLQLPQDSLSYGTRSANPGKENETEFTVDYTEPLKEDLILSVGGKMIFTNITSRSTISSFRADTKQYAFNSALSNNLDYKQRVYALYGEISFPVGKLFDAKIGGRYERTQINSYYSNAQQQAPSHGYNTFAPSLFFLKELSEDQTLKLSYSKRINRPDLEDLNPYINTTDPNNITAGNPYLLPEIGHRVECSYTRNFEKAGSLMITAFYRINEHDIQPFIIFYPSIQVGDSLYTNVAVTIRQNIGTEKNRGMNIFADLHFTDKLNVRSNFFFFQRHTINALDTGYNSNSFNYRFNMNASYQFSKTLAGEFFGNFSSARHEAQGKYPSFISYSLALRKQFWNKKASLALTATNPFSEYVKQRTVVFGPNFTINGLRQVPFRSFGINFTWKFGKLEFKKEKEDNPDNTNTIQDGN